VGGDRFGGGGEPGLRAPALEVVVVLLSQPYVGTRPTRNAKSK
jgi:hypothetical protein